MKGIEEKWGKKMSKYVWVCPDCGRQRKYKYKKVGRCVYCYNKERVAETFERKCPKCGEIKEYKNKTSYDYAVKQGRSCLKCWANSSKRKKLSSKTAKKLFWSGDNPYYDKWCSALSEAGKGKKFSDETILKRAATLCGYESVEDYLAALPEYTKYKRTVRRITNQQPLETLENFDKRGRETYHLDHIISIAEGFRTNILAEKIGHISNLQMLPWKENIKKGWKSEASKMPAMRPNT